MSGSMNDRMIRIDCSSESSEIWGVPEEIQEFIGGVGYGTRILLNEVDPTADPLSPANKIILSVGPLTGTTAPMQPQASLVTKSPLSGTVTNSFVGGFLGAEIKFCGIDGIILEGAFEQWKYIIIEDDKVSFYGAGAVLGRNTEETERYLKERFGKDLVTLSIGRAGENLAAMASIMSETRSFGHGGCGAVLGSKRIKAVGIRGSMGVDVEHRGDFRRVAEENMASIMIDCSSNKNLLGHISHFGAGRSAGWTGSVMIPKNDDPRMEESTALQVSDTLPGRAISCFGCPVHCGRSSRFTGRSGRELQSRGPEYFTLEALAPELMIDDPNVLLEANRLCSLYGLDSLTTGVTILWALEMTEDDLLLTDPGLNLRYGNYQGILDLIVKIGECEGIGELLSRGPKRAAQEIGDEYVDRVLQIKNTGFEPSLPRRMNGIALALATSNRGACYKKAPVREELSDPGKGSSYDGKALMVKNIQDRVTSTQVMVACRFHEYITSDEMYARYITAATGREITAEGFITLGERVWNMERVFNIKAGLTRRDDYLPRRCYAGVSQHGIDQNGLDMDRWNGMLDEYYALRGWDAEGIPGEETLDRLHIDRF